MIPPESLEIGDGVQVVHPVDGALWFFEFLDCRRWADAEGKGYKALLGGNRLQADGTNPNEDPVVQPGNRFRRSRMCSDADCTFQSVSRARVV